MRLRDIIICSLSIVIGVGLIFVAGSRLSYINAERKNMKLVINEPLKNAPPSLAFSTIAMGAFRGLVVDILWMRADKLKDEGQFFDAKQLAEWITTLQPRFAPVWEFQAWNMAYNISVAIPATQPEERWRWVKNGYELLRDKGIVLNPKSIILYRELAMIFQHKIAGVTDDDHKYYKLQLFLAMDPLLGKADNETFKKLASSPKQWSQILADPNVLSFVNQLKAADPIFLDESKFVSNYLALRQNPNNFAAEAFKTVDDFRANPALEKFDYFAKASQLRDVWKLDPVLMQQLNNKYGPTDLDDPNKHYPLDWRHPDTHAIYWAIQGLKKAEKKVFSIDQANTDRIVAHSLQNLFRNGKIYVYDIPVDSNSQEFKAVKYQPKEEIFYRSDLRMFDSYNKSTLAIIDKYKNERKATYVSMQKGHKHMLINATFSFYQAGHIDKAQKIYNELRKLYPGDEFKYTLVGFVKKRLKDELNNIGLNNAKEIIQMMLREAYFRYAMHDDDQASAREQMAKQAYDHYQSAYSDENRINLPQLDKLRYVALLDFFNDHEYPLELRQALLARIKLERPTLAEKLFKQETLMLKEYKESQKKNAQ